MIPELQDFGDRWFFDADPYGVYGHDYFEKYLKYESTPLGQKLNEARLSFVRAWRVPSEPIVDVGIGSGFFVRTCPNTKGFDVNPVGVSWLMDRNLWHDPRVGAPVDCLTFWDSLEHIRDPLPLLRRAAQLVFVALPIFRDRAHVLRSKHFRPTEHFHYFTHEGFLRYMAGAGLVLCDWNNVESRLGREGIESFVFRREEAH